MKRFLKWTAIILGVLILAAFLGFLYFIPPFTLLPPEEFSGPAGTAGPNLDSLTNPAERLLAQRGKYLVTVFDCSGCHTPLGEEGPNWNEYLAGGVRMSFNDHGTYVSRNLTSDKETGLGRRSDDEIKRVLRTGLLPEGRLSYHRDMPWAGTTNLTEEDRHAIVVYLRQLKPIRHAIPDPDPSFKLADPEAEESFDGGDHASH